jgi:ubiquinone biosynthesis protein
MLTTLKYSARLVSIGWTLARHDALFGLEAVNAPPLLMWFCRRVARRSDARLRRGQRLSRALQALGPSFIKAGQALSTRPDLIGDGIAKDLTELQDNVPPFDSRLAKEMVEEQLGAPIRELFASFEDTPVAAASIAQVYFAVLPDGREVAVKILRPRVEEAFQRDIDLMFWMARIVERRLPSYRRYKPIQVVETFANTIRLELDLRFEAAAAEELRVNSKDDPDFYVPFVDWHRTERRVLVTERIRGFSAGDVEGLKNAGIDLTATMEKAARAFFTQVFRDGFFHADMHPGNLFVLPDGRLAPVDFGIMGRIDHHSQLMLAQILWSFMKGNYMRVAVLHREAGYIPAHVSVEQFAQACRAVGTPIMGKALNEISVGKLYGQLLAIAQMFEMEAQPHLLLLQKTMVTAEGVGRGLNPNVNMWQLSEPLIRDWAKKHLSGPAQVRNFAREAVETLRDAPRVLREAKEFLEKTQAQGITLSAPSLATLQTQRANHHRDWMRLGWATLAVVAFIAVELLYF